MIYHIALILQEYKLYKLGFNIPLIQNLSKLQLVVLENLFKKLIKFCHDQGVIWTYFITIVFNQINISTDIMKIESSIRLL